MTLELQDDDGDNVLATIVGGTNTSAFAARALGIATAARRSHLRVYRVFADYFGNRMFFLNSTSGELRMNPMLPQFDQVWRRVVESCTSTLRTVLARRLTARGTWCVL